MNAQSQRCFHVRGKPLQYVQLVFRVFRAADRALHTQRDLNMRVRRDGRGGEIFQAIPPQKVAVERIGLHFLRRQKIAIRNDVPLEEIAALPRPDCPDIAIAPILGVFGAHFPQ